MEEITQLIERLGYPIAVSIWLMWFASAFAGRIQRLLEWAIGAKHQLDHIQLLLQQLTANMPHTTTMQTDEDDEVAEP